MNFTNRDWLLICYGILKGSMGAEDVRYNFLVALERHLFPTPEIKFGASMNEKDLEDLVNYTVTTAP